MESKPSFIDNINGFLTGSFLKRSLSANQNPIEILKRLQRETFSDLMKLRDKQEKIEKILSLHNFGSGSLCQETMTRVRGVIDVLGTVLFIGTDSANGVSSLSRSGSAPGINSRFTFETSAKQKDKFVAEIASGNKSAPYDGSGNFLALSSLMYCTSINDWLSFILLPLGARCTSFQHDSGATKGRHGWFSSYGPPLFNEYHNCAIGCTVRGPNFHASLGELVSGQGERAKPGKCSLTTFGEASYQPVQEVVLSVSGLWQTHCMSSQLERLNLLFVPMGSLKYRMSPGTEDASSSTSRAEKSDSVHTVALKLAAEYDEYSKLDGWVQIEKSNPATVQWGMSLSDTPDHELGWGARVDGIAKGDFSQFHFEGFLNHNIAGSATLQPGLFCTMEGKHRVAGAFVRSSWLL